LENVLVDQASLIDINIEALSVIIVLVNYSGRILIIRFNNNFLRHNMVDI